MRIIIIGFIVAISLIVYKAMFLDSISRTTDPATAFHIDGNATATFTIKDTEGKDYTVAQYGDRFIVEGYDNKLVVFNFFATYCPACKMEIPMLIDLKNKYEDDIQIIGISVDEDLTNDKLENFKSEFGVNYTMNVGTDRLRSLMCDTLPQGSCGSIPLTVIYSKGKLQTFQKGVGGDLSYIEKFISSGS